MTESPESENSLPERIKEQAAYFGKTPERTLKLGKEVTKYNKQLITGKDLTIKTLWKHAMGRNKMKRYFAFVTVGGKDLGEKLIENGYSRIYGVRTTLPDGTDSRT